MLDPACGCGNFLVIAYRELRRLDLDILLRLQELGDDNEMPTIFFTRENLNVSLDHFAGIELEEWPAQITATALHLADHQANQAMELALGQAPQPLPLDKVNNIHVGNALHMNWASIFDPIRHPVMLLGNPPFVGMAYMTADQQADNRHVFAEITTPGLRTGRLDYVACWYAKALPYLANAPFSRAAFVSTNSITQGEQARTMDPLLAQFGCEVDFAHQTFKWTSEAPDAAKVHCVVVGFSRINTTGGQQAKKRRRLYTYKTVTSAPDESIPKRLNFRLEDAETFVPRKLAAPLVAGMPMAHKGSQPTDGKFLIIKESELPELREDQHAAPYLRRYVQGKDMLNDTPRRWCLWLKDADPRDMRASSLLQRRLAGVAEARAKSPTASVRAFADKPALFTQDRQPSTRYFALPEVSSITRRWIPGRYFEPDIVAGNKLIIFPGAQDWHVALLQSSMFATWARQFGGKLKSDYSISPALTYFPIPFPTTTESQRADLEDAIRTVFDVRASFPDASLADLYSPTAMPPSLVDAHLALDSVVDRAFGAKKTLQNNEARAALLQSRYYALTANS